VKGRRGNRPKQLVDDVKDRIGYFNLQRKHCTVLCGELALEEVMDLSYGRLRIE